MNCPTCKSPNTKTCAAAYEQGSRWGRYQTLSELALRCAPPEKRSPIGTFGGLALFAYIFGSLAFFAGHLLRQSEPDVSTLTTLSEELNGPFADPIAIGFWALTAVLASLAVPRIFYNIRHYRDEYKQWQSKWVCLRCGSLFAGPSVESL
ncbi:MAG: hypothetical protein AAF351_11935 [Pseudomonadota bacterium]